MAIKPNNAQTAWLAVFRVAADSDNGEPRAARLERRDLGDAYDKRAAWADAGRVVAGVPGAELLWVSRHLDLVEAVAEWRFERDRARTLVYWPEGSPVRDLPPETLVLEFEEDAPRLADYLDEAPSFLPEDSQPVWLASALDPRLAVAETAATVDWWWRVLLQPEPEEPPELGYVMADTRFMAWEAALHLCGEDAVLWVTKADTVEVALAERDREARTRWTVLGRQIGDRPENPPRVHFFRFDAPLAQEIAREAAMADGRLSTVLWVTQEANQAVAIAEWKGGTGTSWLAVSRGHIWGELSTFRLDYPDRVEPYRAEVDAEFQVDPYLGELVWLTRTLDVEEALEELEAAIPDMRRGHVGHGVFDRPIGTPTPELESS